jgi:hypothetical protein
MKQSIADMKNEVLAGISEIINDEANYFFDFDYGNTASYILYRGTDTKNYVVDIELEVSVAIHNTLGLLLTDVTLKGLDINDEDGEVDIEISEREVKKQLNIF